MEYISIYDTEKLLNAIEELHDKYQESENDPMLQVEVAAMIDEMNYTLKEKLDYVANAITNAELSKKALDEEIKRLENRKLQCARTIETSRSVIRLIMNRYGLSKERTDLHTFSIGFRPGKVKVLREEDLPIQCFKKPEISLTEVRKLIQAGKLDPEVAYQELNEVLTVR